MPARILGGIAVHLLTASGAVCGLIALHHAAAHDWAHSLLWRGAAAILDAIDAEQRYQLSFWDALIVVAAQKGGASVIYSEDFNHGQTFDTVEILNPFEGRG